MQYNFLKKTGFTQHNAFEIHPCHYIERVCFFLLLSSGPLYVYTSLFTCSPIEGYLGCFQFEAIMNRVAINTHVQILCEYKF